MSCFSAREALRGSSRGGRGDEAMPQDPPAIRLDIYRELHRLFLGTINLQCSQIDYNCFNGS